MIDNIDKHRILILDFGSQYTHLIARRIRDLRIYCEIWSWNITDIQIKEFHPKGIILSGGPESITEKNSPQVSEYIFHIGIPIFGICYGMQAMTIRLGGHIKSSTKREFGYAQVKILTDSILVRNIQDKVSVQGTPLMDVWMSHSDTITDIPKNFVTIANTNDCPFAIIANEDKNFYGVQFHPEVTHTRQGQRIFERFVFDICRCKPLWTPNRIIEDMVTKIYDQVGEDRVILGLSGGIDSAVTAVLINRAIGKNLICIFIDNGLLHLNETEKYLKILDDIYGLNIIHIFAADRFFNALIGIISPEEKRKIIGKVFIDIFNEQALCFSGIKWLAQGTIYPDVIESSYKSCGKSNFIKSHHNVGGLPKNMKMKLIEPLKKLFKDEVRKIGVNLGIPYEILYSHPFPGTGLSIRILGEVKKEYCDLLRHSDEILIEELHKANLYDTVSQAFTVFLPIRSVGIFGDNRKYDWIISLRIVESIDFMTANWANLPYKFLDRVSNRIINEINGISRVVYDISGKPPSTIEWE